jgi:hydroxymethylbilane synthase
MASRVIRLACRGSRLSQAQAAETLTILRDLFPADTQFQMLALDTPGDRDKHTPLTDPSIPDDFFTRDIDQALLRGEADLAVHSAKDLPKAQAPGLTVAALLPGKDPRDALVCRSGLNAPSQLKMIGTSSPRRSTEIEKLFPGAKTKSLRGTIDERIEQLDRGEFDAIIVAACALERLGLAHRINQYLPYKTAPLQGRLALTAKDEDGELIRLLKPTDFRLRLFEERPQTPTPFSKETNKPLTLFVGINPQHFPAFEPMIHWPMIELVPTPRPERVAALEATFDPVRGILLASPFAVRCFIDALFHWKDGRALIGKSLLTVGPATAYEIEQMGFHAAKAANGFGGLDSLLKTLDAQDAGRYLYPCSSSAPVERRIVDAKQRGIELVPCPFYENRPHSPGPLPGLPFTRVLFTSPSTVNSYFTTYPDEASHAREWLALGPSTLGALSQKGLKGVLIDEP